MDGVNTYLSALSEPNKNELTRIRKLVIQLVPEAEETFAYTMPAFKYKKKPLIYYAAFKDHLSVFPTSGVPEKLKDKLQGFKLSKGTIQFTLDKPLSDDLIKEIVLSRKSEIDG